MEQALGKVFFIQSLPNQGGEFIAPAYREANSLKQQAFAEKYRDLSGQLNQEIREEAQISLPQQRLGIF